MVNDTISDMLTRIRNASLIKRQAVSIPFTQVSQQISQILEKEGLIDSFQVSISEQSFTRASLRSSVTLSNKTIAEESNSSSEFLILRLKYNGREKTPCITNLKRISKPGLRIYANHKEIPKILGGMGIVILSTSQGIMTDREARLRGIGGELLCSVW